MGYGIQFAPQGEYIGKLWPVFLFVRKISLSVDKFFKIKGLNPRMNDTEWFAVRFPYKSIYGIPDSLNCSESIYQRFIECEQSAHHEWKITVHDYFYETKEFCCFIWSAFNCEVDVIAECNVEYSKMLKQSTYRTYRKVCDDMFCGNDSVCCWFSPANQTKFRLILWVTVAIIFILLIICGTFRIRKSSSSSDPKSILAKGSSVSGMKKTGKIKKKVRFDLPDDGQHIETLKVKNSPLWLIEPSRSKVPDHILDSYEPPIVPRGMTRAKPNILQLMEPSLIPPGPTPTSTPAINLSSLDSLQSETMNRILFQMDSL
ncbi:hypothetical protein BLA29_005164 [Euroglyphus maynei]|uniref:Uncharacterized protein n=1 Tax=Euroglyphus maynei TaxID=6958 RepID=A0A1Y3BI80_EURMA|nr:hypothetical protein BLA29_005164 [Euroglyphus maynei]